MVPNGTMMNGYQWGVGFLQVQFLSQDISLFPTGLVCHARKQNAFYSNVLSLLQKVRVWSMDFHVPMHRCTLNTALLWLCLLLSRKTFVDLAWKPKGIWQKECRQWNCSQQEGCCKLWGFVVSSSILLLWRRTGLSHLPLTAFTRGRVHVISSSPPICETDPLNTIVNNNCQKGHQLRTQWQKPQLRKEKRSV